ncbi:hypothetical protein HY469_01745 [Candidatus Roizmanbacteria bacterium]|nr:hypothetical protein [Candidatus Roizmanbacteria bacterium]
MNLFGLFQPSRLTKEARRFQLELVRQMLTLATSGFGLVAALAWNEMIKEIIEIYIKPYLPQGSGVVSLLIYALFVTMLAVFVTYNLTRIKKQLENKRDAAKKK